jgi:hypothetical protein
MRASTRQSARSQTRNTSIAKENSSDLQTDKHSTDKELKAKSTTRARKSSSARSNPYSKSTAPKVSANNSLQDQTNKQDTSNRSIPNTSTHETSNHDNMPIDETKVSEFETQEDGKRQSIPTPTSAIAQHQKTLTDKQSDKSTSSKKRKEHNLDDKNVNASHVTANVSQQDTNHTKQYSHSNQSFNLHKNILSSKSKSSQQQHNHNRMIDSSAMLPSTSSYAVPDYSSRYQLQADAGEGAFSVVYHANRLCICSQQQLDPLYAISSSSSSNQSQTTHDDGTGCSCDALLPVALKRLSILTSPQRAQDEIEFLQSAKNCKHVSQLQTIHLGDECELPQLLSYGDDDNDTNNNETIIEKQKQQLQFAFQQKKQPKNNTTITNKSSTTIIPPTLVLPYIEHQSYRSYYQHFNIHQIQQYMYALLMALSELHNKQIIHRDVKPGNFCTRFVSNHTSSFDAFQHKTEFALVDDLFVIVVLFLGCFFC